MTLVKYNRPDRDLFSTRFNDILDEFFNNSGSSLSNGNFMPNVDIAENDSEFLIAAELPGMNKEDINVDLDNGRLTISGERKMEDEETGTSYHRVETRYGKFSRSFQLPDSADDNKVSAKYDNGLLNITIGKSEEKVKKQIEIS